MSKEKIWLSSPHMGGKELDFIHEAFNTNWIAPLGPNVNGFEEDLQKYADVKHAAALSSGTAAIHLALVILGIKANDEVLVSSFTFSGSLNPIVYQGATPIMVDSEPETWNMSPEFLEEAIKDRIRKKGRPPKAAIVVHLYGMPAKIEQIQSICKNYDIPIIEDAAEALGSSYKDKKLGSYGDLGVFSFNGNKIITTSGGGALLSNNKAWIEKARFLATQARDSAPHYQHSEIGYNYRMSNILAGVGRGQIQVLEEWVRKRRYLNSLYRKWLEMKEGITFLEEPNESYFSNYWLSTVLLDPKSSEIDREGFRLGLEKVNIESRPLWKPMHLQSIFKDYPYYGNRLSERLFRDGLCLPSGSNLRDDEVERIEKAIKSLF